MKFIKILGVFLCSSIPMFAGVTISAPANGTNSASPVHVVANAASNVPITAMQVYLDGRLVYQQNNTGSINTSVAASNGTHQLVVQQWDSHGNFAKVPVSINVGGSSGTPAPPLAPGAVTISNIDQMSGWQNCGACSGINANGPTEPYSTTQFRSSPSLDGASQEFWLGGSIPYGSAIWWKQLNPQPNASHFTYDLYFYYQNPSAAQALEFDVNQSLNGKKYIFGTECSVAGNHWDVWDSANSHWVNTGIYCPTPAPYTWHHLTWQFERVNGQIHFIAVTLDGHTDYVNRSFWPLPVNAAELNVAFQMDGNIRETNYSVWLDKISISYY